MARTNLGQVPKYFAGFEQVYKGIVGLHRTFLQNQGMSPPKSREFCPKYYTSHEWGWFIPKGTQQQPIANTRQLILWDGGENHCPC